MQSTREQGSSATAVIAVVALMLLAAVSYWVWANHGQHTGSGQAAVKNTSTASTCSKLSLQKGSSDGTAGTIYWHVVVTNNGDESCELTGYPAAFMKDDTGISIGGTSNALYPTAAVTLTSHGGKAHAVVGLPDAGNFDDTVTCTAAASTTLQLYLPGLMSAIETPFKVSACPSFSVTALKAGE